MHDITLSVERDEQSGWFVASWDAPGGGGITTQGRDLRDLEANVREAVRCHFDAGQAPRAIRLLDDYERGLKEYTYLTF